MRPLDNPASPDSILKRVEQKGRISLSTLLNLCEKLSDIGKKFHIAVEVESGCLLKTIDNEQDAKQTIENIENKLKGGK